jgi:tRNA(His) guanylyltransferase
MANSRFEYVRNFEQNDRLLPGCWVVIRIDGRSFSRFTSEHKYVKPLDRRGIDLANACAARVMQELGDITCAYGQSDEFSFVLPPRSNLYSRRASKLSSTICSLFSSSFVFEWPRFFPGEAMLYPPAFDARCICFPVVANLRDYLSWRQTDCHINHLYNVCFHALVSRAGETPAAAEAALNGTVAAGKQELLFSRFSLNYNDEPAVFRKGTVVLRRPRREPPAPQAPREPAPHREAAAACADTECDVAPGADAGSALTPIGQRDEPPPLPPRPDDPEQSKRGTTKPLLIAHDDIIGSRFWDENPVLRGYA